MCHSGSHKQHVHNIKMKVATRNDIINWQTRNGAPVQARSEPKRLHYVIPSLNMQHQSGRDLITLTYWIQNSTLHAEK